MRSSFATEFPTKSHPGRVSVRRNCVYIRRRESTCNYIQHLISLNIIENEEMHITHTHTRLCTVRRHVPRSRHHQSPRKDPRGTLLTQGAVRGIPFLCFSSKMIPLKLLYVAKQR